MFQCDCIEASLDSEQYNGIFPKLERGFCCLMHSTFMTKILLHTLSTGKPLLRSGSLEGRYICGNMRVFFGLGLLFLSVVLAPSCNLGLRINLLWLQAIFFFLSCYFRLLFSMSNPFLPVFLSAFHF